MKTVTADDAIRLLNEALALDPDTMNAMFAPRWYCNKALADHPTIQVWAHPPDGGLPTYMVGLIGLLNGIFVHDEATGLGAIAININDESRKLVGFSRFTPRAATEES
jgi:hypothetical protein